MNIYRVFREGYILVAAASTDEAEAKVEEWESDGTPLGQLWAELQSSDVPDGVIEADPDVLR